ncbi:sodium-dependent transporter [Haloglycomyces albus]|uniref:sodium-dependent transporter n=1 Tax=Haloglycomyces albus TaxID=526067 RepID=UPI00046D0D51|nr:sodium-dependent transporter [Haloglycomyces albus]
MTETSRENWGTRMGFLLAAVGSAIGLGNIWRFPGEAYEGGGGAFLLPWLIALLTAGIPLLILEYTIGRRAQGAGPVAFRALNPKAEGIAWWQVAVAILLATFYALILSWAVSYVGFSTTSQWADEPGVFFGEEFLQAGDDIAQFGQYNGTILVALIGVWAVALFIMWRGIRKGVELANRICIPILLLLFGALVVRSVTLDGATDGLATFFTPQWDKLTDASIWVSAYGQVFFSLSIGMGTMIAYASYLRRNAEITTTAVTAGFANASFELLAGIGVFSVLGFMAAESGGNVISDEAPIDGGALAFVTFPAILNEMPATEVMGLLFFGSLVVAGISSLISMLIVPLAAFQDRFNWSRSKSVLFIGIPMALVSIAIYPTSNGPIILDAVDGAVTTYGLTAAGLATIITAFVSGKIKALADNANRTSVFRIGWFWYACLGLTAVLLSYILLFQHIPQQVDTFRGVAEDANLSPTQVVVTWVIGGCSILFGVVMGMVMRHRATPHRMDEESEENTPSR